jgi:hypothetical protein
VDFWGGTGEARELQTEPAARRRGACGRHLLKAPCDATAGSGENGCVDRGWAARTAGHACADAADRAGSAQASDGARQEKNGWLIAPGLNIAQQSAGTHCTAEFRTGALNTPCRTRQWKSRSRTNRMGALTRNATSRNRA